MTNEINIIETVAPVTEVALPVAKAEGYMAFYSAYKDTASGATSWMCISIPYDPAGQRNVYTLPYPLLTREEAIAGAQKLLPNGGTLRLVKVTL